MTKTCKQCGEIKLETDYRKYYGGRKGSYTVCKLCEKINSREKYLAAKAILTEPEQSELSKIHQLWEAQASHGLRPPRQGKQATSLMDSIDSMMDRYDTVPTVTTVAIPAELHGWLVAELTEDPDYYLDEVYEDLAARYRPILRIDPVNMMPVHDNTYREVLKQILTRFDDYEEDYK